MNRKQRRNANRSTVSWSNEVAPTQPAVPEGGSITPPNSSMMTPVPAIGSSSSANTDSQTTANHDELGKERKDGTDEFERDGKTRTKRAAHLQDYLHNEATLLEELIARNWDPGFGRSCQRCSNGTPAIWKCLECLQYHPTCGRCFIDTHGSQNFLHWAMKGDPQRGLMVKHDITSVGDYALNLGHGGQRCPNARTSHQISITHTNGIHSTRVYWCHCTDTSTSKIRQLMQAGLFPATVTNPKVAFTMAAMKDFSLLQMEGKMNAHDYMATLLRKTSIFPSDIASTVEQFTDAMRIWRLLKTKIWSGQASGIDQLLMRRPAQNLALFCPACPEPGFNDLKLKITHPELRHLCQVQWTFDGNHHLNKLRKNTNPDDISLFSSSYFPSDTEYNSYLGKSDNPQTKSTCNYLKVVNNQNRKKFHNMQVTGVVNCQCSHVFIISSVDLPFGEQFPNADYALLMALLRYIDKEKPGDCLGLDELEGTMSYDIMCAYAALLLSRFEKIFQNGFITQNQYIAIKGFLKRAEKIVPDVHIQGHNENCMYHWGSAYTLCAGHFHGETSEHYWPEANQIGPQTAQMNNGPRQEVISFHHGNWNFKKLLSLHTQLSKDISESFQLYLDKLDDFVSLCYLYSDQISRWINQWPSRKSSDNGASSRYRMRTTLLPSQKQIYESLAAKIDVTPTRNGAPGTDTPSILSLVDLGLEIEHGQHELLAKYKDQLAGSDSKAITSSRKQMRHQIQRFYELQSLLLPLTLLKDVETAVSEPEREPLRLPSSWPASERSRLGLTEQVLETEYQLRQGSINNAYLNIRRIAESISVSRIHSHQTKGTKAKTRAQKREEAQVKQLAMALDEYNRNRQAQEQLFPQRSHWWSSLSREDTMRKPIALRRQLGDSRKLESALFSTRERGGHSGLGMYTSQATHQRAEVGTQMAYREKPGPKPGTKRKREADPVIQAPDKRKLHPEGRIWSQLPGRPQDTEEWVNDSNRVHFFRAEAELERWREQWEMKVVEMLRTRKTFLKYEEVWNELAIRRLPNTGAKAVCLRTAQIFKELTHRVDTELDVLQMKATPRTELEDADLVERQALKALSVKRICDAVAAETNAPGTLEQEVMALRREMKERAEKYLHNALDSAADEM
ncbi:hypothetical protein VNI00_006795 [Paramarasmius palmivorus]|uniref:CxC2-like cysteine cluster KDZ transposase-associated domain-containing protein n=1 Tax=Paramarasmius palmivorus TaxID=297713 RepID=A0AAW0D8T0_9AGAR